MHDIKWCNGLMCVSVNMQVIDDPTGNSFVENRQAPDRDPNLLVTRYHRTDDQEAELGLAPAAVELQEVEEKCDVSCNAFL